jgi:NitT/TauT family transport system permease protein
VLLIVKKIIKRTVLVISIILIWYVSSLHVNQLFIPNPKNVFNDLIISLSDGSLWLAIIYSLRRIISASLLSMIISIPIGLLIYNFTIINDILAPISNAMRYLPVTAFYPLLIMWFGINETMKIMFLFIATFVYMMPSVILCLEEINPDLINTGKTLGMNKWQLITKIQIPASLPSILNSFVVMIGTSFSYIAVCETINAKYGLGWIIQQSSSRGRTDMVFMSIIVITILSVICDMIGKKSIKKIFKWKYLRISDE